MVCECCGQEFKAVRNDAKFCSVKCRVAAHRRGGSSVTGGHARPAASDVTASDGDDTLSQYQKETIAKLEKHGARRAAEHESWMVKHSVTDKHVSVTYNASETDTALPDIIKRFADGKWHSREVIAKCGDFDIALFAAAMEEMPMAGRTTAGISKIESKPIGATFHYRIFPKEPKEHMISSLEMVVKLGPIIERLKTQSKASSITASIATVDLLTHELQQLLNDWTR